MNLLLLTRKVDVNNSRVGFFHDWLDAFAAKTEKLYVVTWQKSSRQGLRHSNIELTVLYGSSARKVFALQKHLVTLLPRVNGIFCHMNPEYAILSAPQAKIFRKKLVCWYTHGTISLRRRAMELLADTVVTASEKSFRKPLRSTTLNIIGHGVNLQRFTYREKVLSKENLALLTAGRISPTKDIETIILSLPLLEKRGVRASLRIVGGPALASDVVYLDNLKTVVRKLSLENRVSFLGEKSFSAMAEEYRNADMVINLSGTGSMDKAVLEAMAAGCLILTSNEAFFGVLQKRFIVQQNNQKDLAEKITALLRAPHSEIRKEKERLRSFVEREHNLDATVQKIMDLYEQ